LNEKSIHIRVSEDEYYKAKEVFPRYGEITSAIKKILLYIIKNPDAARNFINEEGEDIEI